VSPSIEARLRNLQIETAAETKGHCLFVRGDVCALALRAGDGFGSIGSTGIVTEGGPAYLTWRGGTAILSSKGGEAPAEPAQVERIRRFSEDLKTALLSREE
jgi:hypothetical protein